MFLDLIFTDKWFISYHCKLFQLFVQNEAIRFLRKRGSCLNIYKKYVQCSHFLVWFFHGVFPHRLGRN